MMKTYCISDVHGNLKNLISFSNTLSKDDKVYVLGDVVDKGPDSIKALQFIMNDKRFKMILGNHDYMMYRFLTAKSDFEKDAYYEQWFLLNKGEATYTEFSSLDDKTKKSIIEFLSSLPLCLKVTVKSKTFFLSHADPDAKISLEAKDDSLIVEESVWRRIYNFDFKNDDKDVFIIGHTPVQTLFEDYICKPYYTGDSINDAHLIDIDGGLAAKDLLKAKLIVLCLDDLSYKLY